MHVQINNGMLDLETHLQLVAVCGVETYHNLVRQPIAATLTSCSASISRMIQCSASQKLQFQVL
jgi:hypothetical protein